MMNFSEALTELKNGKKIKRSFWGGYWFLGRIEILGEIWEDGEVHDGDNAYEKTDMIIAKLKDGGYAPAAPYQGDLLAEDFEVVE